MLLLPDQPGPFPHILVEAGKEGNLYVINRDQMTTNNSHYCPAPSCTNDPEIIEETGRNGVGIGVGMFNVGAYWNSTLYFWGVQDVLKSIPITNGLPDFTHITASTPELRFPGAGLSVSSNGTTPGSAIVWAIDGTQWGAPGPGPGPAVLYAYDATNILTMLYSSAQNATRDSAGNAVKFAVPTVANGKVYVGTSTEVDVYGLVGTNPLPHISSIAPSSATAGGAAFTLTLTGTGFVTGATVNFGSNPAITPSSVTSTQIVATIPGCRYRHGWHRERNGHESSGRWHIERSNLHHQQSSADGNLPFPHECHCRRRRLHSHCKRNGLCVHIGREIQWCGQDHHLR